MSSQDNSKFTEEPKSLPGPLIVFGTKSSPCGGEGCYCEGEKGICLIIKLGISNGSQLETNEGLAELIELPGNLMRVNIHQEQNPSKNLSL